MGCGSSSSSFAVEQVRLPNLDNSLEQISSDGTRPSAKPLKQKVKNLWKLKTTSTPWRIDFELHDVEEGEGEEEDILGGRGVVVEKKFLGMYTSSDLRNWGRPFGIYEKLKTTAGIDEKELQLSLDTSDEHIHQLFFYVNSELKDDNIVCEIAARRIDSFNHTFAYERQVADGVDYSGDATTSTRLGLRSEWSEREGRKVVELVCRDRIVRPRLDATMMMWMRLQNPRMVFREEGGAEGEGEREGGSSTAGGHSAASSTTPTTAASTGSREGGGGESEAKQVPASQVSQRPRLIGQNKPGLGLAKDMHNLMHYLARRAKRDCLCNRPQYFHNALIYSFSPSFHPTPEGVREPDDITFASDEHLSFHPLQEGVDDPSLLDLRRIEYNEGSKSGRTQANKVVTPANKVKPLPHAGASASQLGDGYWFLNPEFEGIFRTLCEDLKGEVEEKGLAKVTKGIHDGRLKLRKSDTIIVWKSQEQIFPISRRLHVYLNSREYLTVLRDNISEGVFYLDWTSPLPTTAQLQSAPRIEDVDTRRGER